MPIILSMSKDKAKYEELINNLSQKVASSDFKGPDDLKDSELKGSDAFYEAHLDLVLLLNKITSDYPSEQSNHITGLRDKLAHDTLSIRAGDMKDFIQNILGNLSKDLARDDIIPQSPLYNNLYPKSKFQGGGNQAEEAVFLNQLREIQRNGENKTDINYKPESLRYWYAQRLQPICSDLKNLDKNDCSNKVNIAKTAIFWEAVVQMSKHNEGKKFFNEIKLGEPSTRLKNLVRDSIFHSIPSTDLKFFSGNIHESSTLLLKTNDTAANISRYIGKTNKTFGSLIQTYATNIFDARRKPSTPITILSTSHIQQLGNKKSLKEQVFGPQLPTSFNYPPPTDDLERKTSLIDEQVGNSTYRVHYEDEESASLNTDNQDVVALGETMSPSTLSDNQLSGNPPIFVDKDINSMAAFELISNYPDSDEEENVREKQEQLSSSSKKIKTDKDTDEIEEKKQHKKDKYDEEDKWISSIENQIKDTEKKIEECKENPLKKNAFETILRIQKQLLLEAKKRNQQQYDDHSGEKDNTRYEKDDKDDDDLDTLKQPYSTSIGTSYTGQSSSDSEKTSTTGSTYSSGISQHTSSASLQQIKNRSSSLGSTANQGNTKQSEGNTHIIQQITRITQIEYDIQQVENNYKMQIHKRDSRYNEYNSLVSSGTRKHNEISYLLTEANQHDQEAHEAKENVQLLKTKLGEEKNILLAIQSKQKKEKGDDHGEEKNNLIYKRDDEDDSSPPKDKRSHPTSTSTSYTSDSSSGSGKTLTTGDTHPSRTVSSTSSSSSNITTKGTKNKKWENTKNISVTNHPYALTPNIGRGVGTNPKKEELKLTEKALLDMTPRPKNGGGRGS